MDATRQARITGDVKREWAAAAEIEALRASIARLTAERDAAVARVREWERWWADRPSVTATKEYAIHGGVLPAYADPPPPWDGVRRAAGLEEEAPR
jgi:hypothetical protein